MVAIYEKIKLLENFYIYKFVEVVENVEYNAEEDTIKYKKKGKIKNFIEYGRFRFYDIR